MTRSKRSLAGKQGAHTTHSRHYGRDITEAARDKFNQGFLDAVDPDRTLPEVERHRRAEHAKKAYFTKLARKSAQARARRAGGGGRG
jgi:hypothetical protein